LKDGDALAKYFVDKPEKLERYVNPTTGKERPLDWKIDVMKQFDDYEGEYR